MQSTLLSFSPLLSLRKPHTPLSPSISKLNHIFTSSSSSSSFPCQPSSSPSSFKHVLSRPFLHARQTSVPENSSTEFSGGNSLLNILEMVSLFGFWILFNIYFNIYNKQVLKVYHFPLTVSTIQFAVGALLVAFMWGFNLYKRPKLSGAQLAAIWPLALVHTLGNIFTNMSLGKVAVSFTHTIKAMEPFFSVLLSAMFLGENPTAWVVGSLVPIVGGVALASATEASFNWAGFWSAMASNWTNQSRNVLSKKLMVNTEESMDNITLFSIITVMSFVISVPVTLLIEGVKFTPTYLQSSGLNVNEVYMRSLLAALCYHAYQQLRRVLCARNCFSLVNLHNFLWRKREIR